MIKKINQIDMMFFFYGPDDYRAKQKIKALKDKFINEVDATSSSIAEFGGDKWDLREWHEIVAANSLFARRRLVIVSGLLSRKDKTFLDSFVDYLEHNDAGDNIWVIYEPRLTLNKKKEIVSLDSDDKETKLTIINKRFFDAFKNGQSQYFATLSGKDLLQWLTEYLASSGVSISYQAAQTLLACLETGNLWLLSSELNKLMAYKKAVGGELMISTDDVRLLVNGDIEQTIFALTDAISANNKGQALKLLEEQVQQGMNAVYLLTMLIRQIKILLSVRQSLDSGETPAKIASRLKLHPYVLQKALNQARNFRLEALKKAFTELIDLDMCIKTGQEDFMARLTKLIIEL